jgi:hypothetical protein
MKTEPTEALKEIKRCSWEVDFNISDGLESYEVVDKDDAINIANIAFREGQSSPKIKQLEWDFYGTYYSAETPVVNYMITQENDFIENDDDCALWVNGSLILHSTFEEAKSAAQAGFEKRVMECLD